LRLACIAGTVSYGAATGWAADSATNSTTAETLQKVHDANQKEIAMGKQASDRGRTKETKAFGRMLVKDHTAADAKVEKLAKDEGITLTTHAPSDADMLPAGEGYDAAFAKMMLDDHERDISEITTARDGTSDAKLKQLLTDILPTLKKHEDRAQHLVDKGNKA